MRKRVDDTSKCLRSLTICVTDGLLTNGLSLVWFERATSGATNNQRGIQNNRPTLPSKRNSCRHPRVSPKVPASQYARPTPTCPPKKNKLKIVERLPTPDHFVKILVADGCRVASPTPTSILGASMVKNEVARPLMAVIRLHTKTPTVTTFAGLYRSANTPITGPLSA